MDLWLPLSPGMVGKVGDMGSRASAPDQGKTSLTPTQPSCQPWGGGEHHAPLQLPTLQEGGWAGAWEIILCLYSYSPINPHEYFPMLSSSKEKLSPESIFSLVPILFSEGGLGRFFSQKHSCKQMLKCMSLKLLFFKMKGKCSQHGSSDWNSEKENDLARVTHANASERFGRLNTKKMTLIWGFHLQKSQFMHEY